MKNGIAQLLKIELAMRTVFLSDGGFIVFDGDTYVGGDVLLGSIAGIDPFEAGFGGSISQIDVTFHPPPFQGSISGDWILAAGVWSDSGVWDDQSFWIDTGSNAVAALSEAALRNRRIEMFVVEYDPATGLITGTPERKFVGQVDQTTRSLVSKTVGVSCTSRAEPIFSKNAGNAMSHEFQQLISPGDTGFAQTTGLAKQWAWGTASVSGTGGFFGGDAGGGGSVENNPNVRQN